MSVLIGIDVGTTMLKAAAFEAASGRAVANASVRLPVHAEADGTREQDPRALDRALVRVLAQLRQDLGKRWSAVAGVGLAAQGGSAAIVERETARPLSAMMLWNDSRAYRFIPEIAACKSRRYWRALCSRDDPGAGLARILWLKRTRPELFAERNLYVGAGEYLFFRLTETWRQDAGNAHQIGCYSVRQQDLVPEPAALVDVPLSLFAPLRRGHETHPVSATAARRTGLPAGAPVAGPYFDHEAGYLSAVAPRSRPLQCSLGTAWVGNFILPDNTVGGSPFQFVVPAPVGEGRLVVQPLLTGNVTWDWALANFVHADHARALARLPKIFDKALLPPRGLVAVPWFNWSNPLLPEAVGAGMFYGANLHTSPHDFLRALAAGMSCELARLFAEVRDSGCVDRVVLGGGAGKGAFFRTLIAALFDPLPVYRLLDEDLAGARGTVFTFSRTAARARAERVPRPARAVREQVLANYDLYRQVFDRLYGAVPAGGAFRLGRSYQERSHDRS